MLMAVFGYLMLILIMILTLNHQKLDVFIQARKLLLACYTVTKLFPGDERFGLVQQIRRAALSVVLNIAEGASRKSEKERKRFYEIARGSITEIDAALDVVVDLKYVNHDDLNNIKDPMLRSFQMLSKLITL